MCLCVTCKKSTYWYMKNKFLQASFSYLALVPVAWSSSAKPESSVWDWNPCHYSGVLLVIYQCIYVYRTKSGGHGRRAEEPFWIFVSYLFLFFGVCHIICLNDWSKIFLTKIRVCTCICAFSKIGIRSLRNKAKA